MNKNILRIFLMSVTIIANGQIDCNPSLGFAFTPIEKGIPLYQEPNFDSELVLKTPEPSQIFLNCTDSEINNDFIQVKVDFLIGAFSDNGVNNLLYWLHHYLINDYNFKFDFKSFIEFIDIEKNQKEIYNLLINDEKNDWFKEYSDDIDYDVSSFQGFYRNWIYYDKENSNDQYIINNQGKIVYVHKNSITNEGGITPVLTGAKSDFYLESINDQIELKNKNSCIYNESMLIFYFEFYANALIRENKPFKVIQEANNISGEFQEMTSLYRLDFLKLKASYFDRNYVSAIDISKNLIDKFALKKFKNSKQFYGGDIDMSEVYVFLISSLLQTEQYSKALNYSQSISKDSSLIFGQFAEFYAFALLNLNRKNEACDILREAYLNGNEDARTMLIEYCE